MNTNHPTHISRRSLTAGLLTAVAIPACWLGLAAGASAKNTPVKPAPAALGAQSIGAAAFGQPTKSVLSTLEGVEHAKPSITATAPVCGIDSTAAWKDLTAYFLHGHFVGYSDSIGSSLATSRGLHAGDTVGQAKSIYGASFGTTLAQGGDWHLNTAAGKLSGFLLDTPPVQSTTKLKTIEAGQLGCAADRP